MLYSRMKKFCLILLVFFITLSCRQSGQSLTIPTLVNSKPVDISTPSLKSTPTTTAFLPFIRNPDDPTIKTPTPDITRVLPEIRSEEVRYVVQRGDSLGKIAAMYEINVPMLLGANQIPNPDLLEIGQELTIPAPIPGEPGSNFKVIPDSELVFGPLAQSFDVKKFVDQFDSYLSRYSEEVEGRTLTGPEIVQFVAQDYSVNPRLLLAILEYQSGWVTQANPPQDTLDFPIGNKDSWRKGLYLQLAWAANNLNRGYYLWKVNGVGGWLLSNGIIIPIDPSINAGTAGVQQFFSLLNDRTGWDHAVSRMEYSPRIVVSLAIRLIMPLNH